MQFTHLQKKYTIKIPENVTAFYCDKKKIVTFLGPLKKKSFKPVVKLFFSNQDNLLIVSDLPEEKKFINKKKTKVLQGTTVSLIKQILIEINYKLYQKLKLVGVGYRAFQMDNPLKNQISLKLGHSHIIYFKIPETIRSHVIRFTTLFIFGNSSQELISTLASLIRNCRPPEPYKGKGVLYYEEKITLKRGKKI